MTRTGVVIVDDSALMRQILRAIVEDSEDLQVLGEASDPLQAREVIRATNPDVITLDVEMPRMDGLEFLRRLMHLRPTPVVMISTLTVRGSGVALRAFELGAVEVIAKPDLRQAQHMHAYAEDLRQILRAAASARLRPQAVSTLPAAPALNTRIDKVVVVGASTGGTEAIKALLTALPAQMPPILIAQHMPPEFTASFARRLDGLCALSVKEAADGEVLQRGHVYIAPGGQHLLLEKKDAQTSVCRLSDSEPVNRHRPSVDVLMQSVAEVAAQKACGILLTGMGKDGAEGLLKLRQAGAWTCAEDESSCIVFGMPRAAIQLAAAVDVLPLNRIAAALMAQLAH